MNSIIPISDKIQPANSNKLNEISAASPPAPCTNNNEDELSASIRLYLRHVEGGESIRSIARDTGCHPSTILRRIRRFENRRDDPLVDKALQNLGMTSLPKRDERDPAQESSRVLRRLAERNAELIVAQDLDKAIVIRDKIQTTTVSRQIAEDFALKGWIGQVSQGKRIIRYRITVAGRSVLRHNRAGLPFAPDFADAVPVPEQAMTEAPVSFNHGDKHRVWGHRDLPDPDNGKPQRMRINLAESPLLLLARRRDAKGNPFLSDDLVRVGERLREDFELAQMGSRVTQNWSRFLTAGVDESRQADRHAGGSEQARERVAAALREIGPGMGDLVLRVCCYLEGIEITERRLGWSARSGKIVLKLALERLVRHYEKHYGSGEPMIG